MNSLITALHPTRDSLADFLREAPAATPIVMLNLLRFQPLAAYTPGTAGSAATGRQAYDEYVRLLFPILSALGGQLVWRGQAKSTLIAPQGEQWDEVLLVRYPAREAFLQMTRSPDYKAIVHHRTEALEDSRLVATVEDSRQALGSAVSPAPSCAADQPAPA